MRGKSVRCLLKADDEAEKQEIGGNTPKKSRLPVGSVLKKQTAVPKIAKSLFVQRFPMRKGIIC
jgi:hypothetical protein